MATPKQTDPQFKLRLPAALKQQIENSAAENNRSMNAEIVARLEESFDNDPMQNDVVVANQIIENLLGFAIKLDGELLSEPLAHEIEAATAFLSGVPSSLLHEYKLLDLMEKNEKFNEIIEYIDGTKYHVILRMIKILQDENYTIVDKNEF